MTRLPMTRLPTLQGRGVTPNPANRFERITLELDPSSTRDDPAPRTQFFKDSTRSIRGAQHESGRGFRIERKPVPGL